MNRISYILPVTSLGLLATAFGGGAELSGQPSNTGTVEASARDASSPAATLQEFVDAVKANSVSRMVRLLATDAEFAEMSKEWDKKRKEPVPAAEAAQFEQAMAMITAPGAEATLFALVQPQLAEAQQNMMMLAAMGPMMAAGALQEADAPEELMGIVSGVSSKLASLDVGSETKAKKAISIVCRAARSLRLKTMDDVVKMDMRTLLTKADTAFGAVMSVLNVYGLGLGATCDSVSIQTVSVEGNTAELSVSMKLYGFDIDPFPVMMEKQGSRWMFTRPEGTETLLENN